MNKIIFRVDGNSRIGFGHVMRSLAIAEMLDDRFSCEFWIQDPPRFIEDQILAQGFGVKKLPHEEVLTKEAFSLFKQGIEKEWIIVLDGYGFVEKYQEVIKANRNPLVVIDDLAKGHCLADLIINHADGVHREDYSTESYTRLCLGGKYAMLRKPFLECAKEKRRVDAPISLFLCMGGSQNKVLLRKALEACKALPLETIEVVGEDPSNTSGTKTFPKINYHGLLSVEKMIALMKRCQVAVCPSSTLSLETCAVGMGLFTGTTVDNQEFIYQGLMRKGAAFGLNDLNEGEPEEWNALIGEALASPDKLSEKVKIQHELIDGKSPVRIMKAFEKLNQLK